MFGGGLLSILLIAAPESAEPAPTASTLKPDLVVLALRPGPGVSVDLAEVLGEVLLVNLGQSGVFHQITSSADLQSMLDLEQQKDVLGCEDDSCLAQLGGTLGVPYMLRCRIGQVGQRYVVTLHLIGVDDARVVARSMTQAKAEGDLPVAIAGAVPLLVKNFRSQNTPTGSVAPPVTPPKSSPRRQWLPRLGYGLAGLGLGVIGWSWMTSSTAQAQLSGGPTVVTAPVVESAQSKIDEANQLAWMGGGLSVAGLGLVVWGHLP